MTRNELSAAIGGISDRHIQEAADYTAAKKRGLFHRPPARGLAAAVLALCLLAGGSGWMLLSGGSAVSAYACGTDAALTPAGAELQTGLIRDSGELTGHPLQFYLTGEGIASVRFSCENQFLSFTDWTEQRPGYGLAQNFTVPYGGDESEYYYLLVDWVPQATIRALTDDPAAAIATLPETLRRDRVVLEIAFADGTSAVKCIDIRLLDSGYFFASFHDYTVTAEDAFVHRGDAAALSSGEPEGNTEGKAAEDTGGEPIPDTDLDAARSAALRYYGGTVFTVLSMDLAERTGDGLRFSVRVSRGGVEQQPARSIWLRHTGSGEWEVANEGY